MRICFVVGDVGAQQPTYAGIYLALAAHRRGHDVRFVSVAELSFLDDNTVLGTTRRVRHGDYARPADYARALSSDEAVTEEDNLGSFDVVFLRFNPTRESAVRGGAPLIDFCWRLRLGGTLVVNDPEGLRRAGSRMYLADFPADIRAKTLVSRSPERLKDWVRALRGPAVLKPLQPRGGEHVFFVRRRQFSNLNQIITTVTKNGYAIAQEYLPEIEDGEKRLLLLGGEPIRSGKRVAIYRRHVQSLGPADAIEEPHRTSPTGKAADTKAAAPKAPTTKTASTKAVTAKALALKAAIAKAATTKTATTKTATTKTVNTKTAAIKAAAMKMATTKAAATNAAITAPASANDTPTEATGARARCDFGPAEARICDLIRPRLVADGLYLVGVDIVGDKILQLNVFTPGGMHSVHELYGFDVADLVVQDLERRVGLRLAYRGTFDPEAADIV